MLSIETKLLVVFEFVGMKPAYVSAPVERGGLGWIYDFCDYCTDMCLLQVTAQDVVGPIYIRVHDGIVRVSFLLFSCYSDGPQ